MLYNLLCMYKNGFYAKKIYFDNAKTNYTRGDLFVYNPRSYRRFLQASVTAAIVASSVGPVATVSAAEMFTDVSKDHWAYESINKLAKEKVIQGFLDDSFRPGATLTRGHAAELLTRALNLPLQEVVEAPFNDVPQHSRVAPYAHALKEAGIFLGNHNGDFMTDSNLSRQEMASILVRAFNLKSNDTANITFVDFDTINDSHKQDVETIASIGITLGIGNDEYGPFGDVNRAQMAVFLDRTLSHIEQIQEQTIEEIQGSNITISGTTYAVSSEVKGILHEKNASVLQNATIAFNKVENEITSIEFFKLNQSGTVESPLVLDGGNQVIAGDVEISGDYLSLTNIKIDGDLTLNNEVDHQFSSENLTVEGKVSFVEDEKEVSISSLNQTKLNFSNSKLQQLVVSKNNVNVAATGTTSFEEVTVTANAEISGQNLTIPKLTLRNGTLSIEAAIDSLVVDSANEVTLLGQGNINNLEIIQQGNVYLETKGTIRELNIANENATVNIGADTKLTNVTLPNDQKVEKFIRNFDDIKGNIEKVAGEKLPIEDLHPDLPIDDEDEDEGDSEQSEEDETPDPTPPAPNPWQPAPQPDPEPSPTIESLAWETQELQIYENGEYLDSLPATVVATMSDGSEVEHDISWDDSNVDVSIVDTYTILGTVDGYAGSPLEFHLEVIDLPIVSLQWERQQKEIYENETYTLPETVTANMEDGSTADFQINWDESIVDVAQVGTYNIEGTVDRYEGDPIIFRLIVEDAPVEVFITSLDWLTKTEEIQLGESYTLPQTVTTTLSDGQTGEADITWDESTVDVNKVGTYTVLGTVADFDDKEVQYRVTVSLDGYEVDGSSATVTNEAAFKYAVAEPSIDQIILNTELSLTSPLEINKEVNVPASKDGYVLDFGQSTINHLTIDGNNTTVKNATIKNLTVGSDVTNVILENIEDVEGGVHTFDGGGGESIVLRGSTNLRGSIRITTNSDIQIRSEANGEEEAPKISGQVRVQTGAKTIISSPVAQLQIDNENNEIEVNAPVENLRVRASAEINEGEGASVGSRERTSNAVVKVNGEERNEEFQEVVDTQNLEDVISEVELLLSEAVEGDKNGQYEEGSITPLQEKLNDAKQFLVQFSDGENPENVEQSVIGEKETQLSAALANFEGQIVVVDFTSLIEKIDAATVNLDGAEIGSANGQHPLLAVLGLELAIDNAKQVVNVGSAADVDEAISLLDDVVSQFNDAEISIDRTDLDAAIISAQDLIDHSVPGLAHGQFPQSAVDRLQSAIDAATNTQSNEQASQSAINRAQDTLEDAIERFEAREIVIELQHLGDAVSNANQTLSEAVVGKSTGQYEQEDKDTFAAAITVAEAIFADPLSTQDDVDDAVKDLNNAKAAFEATTINVDFEPLQEVVEAADEIYDTAVSGDFAHHYAQEDLEAYETAINAAKEVLNNEMSTQVEVDDATVALTTATDAFDQVTDVVIEKLEAIAEADEKIALIPDVEDINYNNFEEVELFIAEAKSSVEAAQLKDAVDTDFAQFEKIQEAEEKLETLLNEKNTAILAVNNAIDNLPDPGSITYTDIEDVEDELAYIESLISEAKTKSATNEDFSDLEKITSLEEQIAELIETKEAAVLATKAAINQLPKVQNVSYDTLATDREKLDEALDALDDALAKGAEEAEITNLATLTNIQTKVVQLEQSKAESITFANAAIDNLPDLEDVSFETLMTSKEQLKATKTAVEEARTKGAVDTDFTNLEHLDAVNTLIQEKLTTRNEAITAVNEALALIPELDDITHNNFEEVEGMLDTAQEKIEFALNHGAELEDLGDHERVATAQEKINGLKQTLTEAVEAANDRLALIPEVDAITFETFAEVRTKINTAKAAISAARENGAEDEDFIGLSQLQEAEDKVEQLQQQKQEAIDAANQTLEEIPAVDDITYENFRGLSTVITNAVTAIETAREKTATDSHFVGLDKIEEAEAKIATLTEALTMALEAANDAIDALPLPAEVTEDNVPNIRTEVQAVEAIIQEARQKGALDSEFIGLELLEELHDILREFGISPEQALEEANVALAYLNSAYEPITDENINDIRLAYFEAYLAVAQAKAVGVEEVDFDQDAYALYETVADELEQFTTVRPDYTDLLELLAQVNDDPETLTLQQLQQLTRMWFHYGEFDQYKAKIVEYHSISGELTLADLRYIIQYMTDFIDGGNRYNIIDQEVDLELVAAVQEINEDPINVDVEKIRKVASFLITDSDAFFADVREAISVAKTTKARDLTQSEIRTAVYEINKDHALILINEDPSAVTNLRVVIDWAINHSTNWEDHTTLQWNFEDAYRVKLTQTVQQQTLTVEELREVVRQVNGEEFDRVVSTINRHLPNVTANQFTPIFYTDSWVMPLLIEELVKLKAEKQADLTREEIHNVYRELVSTTSLDYINENPNSFDIDALRDVVNLSTPLYRLGHYRDKVSEIKETHGTLTKEDINAAVQIVNDQYSATALNDINNNPSTFSFSSLRAVTNQAKYDYLDQYRQVIVDAASVLTENEVKTLVVQTNKELALVPFNASLPNFIYEDLNKIISIDRQLFANYEEAILEEWNTNQVDLTLDQLQDIINTVNANLVQIAIEEINDTPENVTSLLLNQAGVWHRAEHMEAYRPAIVDLVEASDVAITAQEIQQLIYEVHDLIALEFINNNPDTFTVEHIWDANIPVSVNRDFIDDYRDEISTKLSIKGEALTKDEVKEAIQTVNDNRWALSLDRINEDPANASFTDINQVAYNNGLEEYLDDYRLGLNDYRQTLGRDMTQHEIYIMVENINSNKKLTFINANPNLFTRVDLMRALKWRASVHSDRFNDYQAAITSDQDYGSLTYDQLLSIVLNVNAQEDLNKINNDPQSITLEDLWSVLRSWNLLVNSNLEAYREAIEDHVAEGNLIETVEDLETIISEVNDAGVARAIDAINADPSGFAYELLDQAEIYGIYRSEEWVSYYQLAVYEKKQAENRDLTQDEIKQAVEEGAFLVRLAALDEINANIDTFDFETLKQAVSWVREERFSYLQQAIIEKRDELDEELSISDLEDASRDGNNLYWDALEQIAVDFINDNLETFTYEDMKDLRIYINEDRVEFYREAIQESIANKGNALTKEELYDAIWEGNNLYEEVKKEEGLTAINADPNGFTITDLENALLWNIQSDHFYDYRNAIAQWIDDNGEISFTEVQQVYFMVRGDRGLVAINQNPSSFTMNDLYNVLDYYNFTRTGSHVGWSSNRLEQYQDAITAAFDPAIESLTIEDVAQIVDNVNKYELLQVIINNPSSFTRDDLGRVVGWSIAKNDNIEAYREAVTSFLEEADMITVSELTSLTKEVNFNELLNTINNDPANVDRTTLLNLFMDDYDNVYDFIVSGNMTEYRTALADKRDLEGPLDKEQIEQVIIEVNEEVSINRLTSNLTSFSEWDLRQVVGAENVFGGILDRYREAIGEEVNSGTELNSEVVLDIVLEVNNDTTEDYLAEFGSSEETIDNNKLRHLINYHFKPAETIVFWNNRDQYTVAIQDFVSDDTELTVENLYALVIDVNAELLAERLAAINNNPTGFTINELNVLIGFNVALSNLERFREAINAKIIENEGPLTREQIIATVNAVNDAIHEERLAAINDHPYTFTEQNLRNLVHFQHDEHFERYRTAISDEIVASGPLTHNEMHSIVNTVNDEIRDEALEKINTDTFSVTYDELRLVSNSFIDQQRMQQYLVTFAKMIKDEGPLTFTSLRDAVTEVNNLPYLIAQTFPNEPLMQGDDLRVGSVGGKLYLVLQSEASDIQSEQDLIDIVDAENGETIITNEHSYSSHHFVNTEGLPVGTYVAYAVNSNGEISLPSLPVELIEPYQTIHSVTIYEMSRSVEVYVDTRLVDNNQEVSYELVNTDGTSLENTYVETSYIFSNYSSQFVNFNHLPSEIAYGTYKIKVSIGDDLVEYTEEFEYLPAAPNVTIDDWNNVFIDADETMEYRRSSNEDWVTYDPNNPPVFEGGNWTYIRYKETGDTPASVTKAVLFSQTPKEFGNSVTVEFDEITQELSLHIDTSEVLNDNQNYWSYQVYTQDEVFDLSENGIPVVYSVPFETSGTYALTETQNGQHVLVVYYDRWYRAIAYYEGQINVDLPEAPEAFDINITNVIVSGNTVTVEGTVDNFTDNELIIALAMPALNDEVYTHATITDDTFTATFEEVPAGTNLLSFVVANEEVDVTFTEGLTSEVVVEEVDEGKDEETDETVSTLADLGEHAYRIDDNSQFGSWGVNIYLDSLPEGFAGATGFVLVVEENKFEFIENPYNSNILSTSVPADDYTKQDVEGALFKSKTTEVPVSEIEEAVFSLMGKLQYVKEGTTEAEIDEASELVDQLPDSYEEKEYLHDLINSAYDQITPEGFAAITLLRSILEEDYHLNSDVEFEDILALQEAIGELEQGTYFKERIENDLRNVVQQFANSVDEVEDLVEFFFDDQHGYVRPSVTEADLDVIHELITFLPDGWHRNWLLSRVDEAYPQVTPEGKAAIEVYYSLINEWGEFSKDITPEQIAEFEAVVTALEDSSFKDRLMNELNWLEAKEIYDDIRRIKVVYTYVDPTASQEDIDLILEKVEALPERNHNKERLLENVNALYEHLRDDVRSVIEAYSSLFIVKTISHKDDYYEEDYDYYEEDHDHYVLRSDLTEAEIVDVETQILALSEDLKVRDSLINDISWIKEDFEAKDAREAAESLLTYNRETGRDELVDGVTQKDIDHAMSLVELLSDENGWKSHLEWLTQEAQALLSELNHESLITEIDKYVDLATIGASVAEGSDVTDLIIQLVDGETADTTITIVPLQDATTDPDLNASFLTIDEKEGTVILTELNTTGQNVYEAVLLSFSKGLEVMYKVVEVQIESQTVDSDQDDIESNDPVQNDPAADETDDYTESEDADADETTDEDQEDDDDVVEVDEEDDLDDYESESSTTDETKSNE